MDTFDLHEAIRDAIKARAMEPDATSLALRIAGARTLGYEAFESPIVRFAVGQEIAALEAAGEIVLVDGVYKVPSPNPERYPEPEGQSLAEMALELASRVVGYFDAEERHVPRIAGMVRQYLPPLCVSGPNGCLHTAECIRRGEAWEEDRTIYLTENRPEDSQ